MPSVWTIEGAGRRRRKKKKRGGGRASTAFKKAHKDCVRDGYKPFTKPFGSCMKDKLGR